MLQHTKMVCGKKTIFGWYFLGRRNSLLSILESMTGEIEGLLSKLAKNIDEVLFFIISITNKRETFTCLDEGIRWSKQS
jgi:hypothetical protein